MVSHFKPVQHLTAADEDELIQKCEDNIKRGQFNSTIKEIRHIVLSYRARSAKFHRPALLITYLVCLAHTDPMGTLRELWNMHKGRAGHGFTLTGEDLARILCITIQGTSSYKNHLHSTAF